MNLTVDRLFNCVNSTARVQVRYQCVRCSLELDTNHYHPSCMPLPREVLLSTSLIIHRNHASLRQVISFKRIQAFRAKDEDFGCVAKKGVRPG